MPSNWETHRIHRPTTTHHYPLTYLSLLTRPLTLDAVAPASATVAGDAPLRVTGANFAPVPGVAVLCTFSQFGGMLGVTPASYTSPTELRCASPLLLPDDAGAAALTLTTLVDGEAATGAPPNPLCTASVVHKVAQHRLS